MLNGDHSLRVSRMGVLLGLLTLAGVYCAPAAPSPTAPAPKPAAEPKAAAPPAAKPAASPPAKPDSTAQWAEVVAAAKREGKAVVYGIFGAENQVALTEGFKQKYSDIQVDYSAASGAQQVAKVTSEQAAGQYLADVVLGGTTSFLLTYLPGNNIVPMEPFLIGPDIEPSKWEGGKLEFSDEAGRHNLVMTAQVSPPFAYNASLVGSGEITSWKDLLTPRWKGKVVMHDPRLPGAGNALATFWYLSDQLGKDFLDQLFKQQDVTVTRDDRQLIDWVARGQYPIGIGASDVLATELRKAGVPIEFASTLREGSSVSAGNGSASIATRAPHPNAAKLYLNWLLSRGGQTDFSRSTGQVSRRTDVPRDHLTEWVIPKPGGHYIVTYTEVRVRLKPEIDELLRSLIPGG